MSTSNRHREYCGVMAYNTLIPIVMPAVISLHCVLMSYVLSMASYETGPLLLYCERVVRTPRPAFILLSVSPTRYLIDFFNQGWASNLYRVLL